MQISTANTPYITAINFMAGSAWLCPMLDFTPPFTFINKIILGRFRPILGKLRPTLGELCPILGKLRPTLGKLCPTSGKLRPTLGELCPT